MSVIRIVSILACVFTATAVSAADPAASQLRSLGNEHEYNLRIDEALRHFRQAVDADPDDPASYRAVAATYMMEIAFRRGAVTADDFLGEEVAANKLDMPKPAPDLALGFHTNADRALRLAEGQVRTRPNDADAHYQLGVAIALIASYSATVDGQVFNAFKLARRAYKENSRALEIDPRRHDAGLVVGAYQYIVSTRSFPIRWVARIAGLESNKARGVALIEQAARYPGENQTDARLLLAVIYNREQRYGDALQVLSQLETQYPDNRLLWLEEGATALRAGRFADAHRALDAGLIKLSKATSLRAFGEEALWHYKRGAARVGLHRDAEAASDLTLALGKEARGWVHARAHIEMGKLADLTGNRNAARREYQIALQMAKAADDSIGFEDARRLLDTPYQARKDARDSISLPAFLSGSWDIKVPTLDTKNRGESRWPDT
jgi:tetratricopeptide (TPR) repeat protein